MKQDRFKIHLSRHLADKTPDLLDKGIATSRIRKYCRPHYRTQTIVEEQNLNSNSGDNKTMPLALATSIDETSLSSLSQHRHEEMSDR